MVPSPVKVFIVDDIPETIASIKNLIAIEQDLTVVGEAGCAEDALALLPQVSVDVVLMDINMGGIDGIRATEMLRERYPDLIIVLMSVQQEPEYFQRAMLAGAHNYLLKPFAYYELVTTINNTLERQRKLKAKQLDLDGEVIAVFGTKGGTGKTTLAVNLAVALKKHSEKPVVLIDGMLSFGDVALFVNLQPKWTIYDAAREGRKEPASWSDELLMDGPEGVKVLLAPIRPEQAETVTPDVLGAAIKFFKTKSAYVLVDLDSSFSDSAINTILAADRVLIVATPDLPSVKNVCLALETMDKIGIDKDKVKVVLNRINSEGALDTATTLKMLNHTVIAALPSDGKTVMHALNRGTPFVIAQPATEISKEISRLAAVIDGEANDAAPGGEKSFRGGWRRWFGGE